MLVYLQSQSISLPYPVLYCKQYSRLRQLVYPAQTVGTSADQHTVQAEK